MAVLSKSYTLHEGGEWLGQIVLTDDGMFAGVTDYGNLSFAWRSFGKGDFRAFLTTLNVDYFATKMATGMAYILHSRKTDAACLLFANMILPALQKALESELAAGIGWEPAKQSER